jgi:hypothetical protein
MSSINPRATDDTGQPRLWLAEALDGTDCRAMERYLHTVAQKIDEGRLGEALRMSSVLPEICSMLEHPQMRTSSAHCVCWCDAWVSMESDDDEHVFPLTRFYLRHEGEDAAQWIATDAHFARAVSRALLDAATAWYRQRGAFDLTVQYNLGKVSGC